MTPEQIFLLLVSVMGSDNNCCFKPTPEQTAAALPPIQKMMDAGFFSKPLDNQDEYDHFWMMAAGEDTEQKVFFAKAAEAHAELNDILNDVFDGELNDD